MVFFRQAAAYGVVEFHVFQGREFAVGQFQAQTAGKAGLADVPVVEEGVVFVGRDYGKLNVAAEGTTVRPLIVVMAGNPAL